MTYNQYLAPWLKEDIDYISAKSASQVLSLNLA